MLNIVDIAKQLSNAIMKIYNKIFEIECKDNNYAVVVSKTHMSKETQFFISKGSLFKHCMAAEWVANIFVTCSYYGMGYSCSRCNSKRIRKNDLPI